METIAQRVTETEVVLKEPKSEIEQSPSAGDSVEYAPSEMKEPYLIELLDIKSAKTHFEMPGLIKEINDFVMSEIERNGLKDDKETYEEIVNHYLKKLNLPNGIDIYTKTEKLVELMRINKKLLDAAKAKEELLTKPIEELSSAQLKKRLGL